MYEATTCSCPGTIAMASIPIQEWCKPYDLCTALNEGTIFPCLNLTFFKAPEGIFSQPPCSNSSNTDQLDREKTMSQLAAVTFALNDLTLYLDTHPDCPNGTAMFYQLMEQRLSLLAAFANDHYPLTQSSMITGNCSQTHYGWSDGPMPWEGACI